MPGIRLSGLTLGPFASAIKLLGPFRLKSLLFPVYWGSPFSYGLLGNFAQHITFLFSFSSLFSREPPGCSDCGWEVIFKEYRSWYGDDSLVSFHFISPRYKRNWFKKMSDGTVVLFTSFLLFFIPAQNRAVGRRLLEWDSVIKQLPWDILLLLGTTCETMSV